MKRTLIISLLVICSFVTFGQNKIESYTASDNITYHIGDTIKLGTGSDNKGNFKYLQMGGFYNTMAAMNGDYQDVASSVGRNYSGLNVVIKKIKEQKFKGGTKVIFVVGGGNLTNYNLMIEEALKTGEVASTGMSSDEALTQLKKEKDKFDLGLITSEEYEAKKQELKQFIK